MVVYLLDVVEMPYNYEDIILINNEWQYEFFRLRSAGCRDDARELLYSIPPSNEADCYFVGQHFFEFEEYYPAIEMLTYCIDFGYKNNSSWYRSMAYLLRAYSFAKIGKYSEAEKDISYLDDEIKVAWLPHPEKEISKAVITSMLR